MENNEIFGIEKITSKTNSTIVKIGKLCDKKYRKADEMFVCHGIKLFYEAINYGASIRYIVLNNSVKFDENLIKKIKQEKEKNADIICVSCDVFEKLTEEQAPQGIITVCDYHNEKHTFSTIAENIDSTDSILMLESIRDPGNLGTIIRNAAAFGVNKLILSSDCVDIYSSKVIRGAMGAIFKVEINVVSDFQETINTLKKLGRNVLSATLGTDSLMLGDYNLQPQDVIVIGNEGHGLSASTIESSNNTILIPMNDNTESLNAAMAATVFMWEMSKLK